MNAHTDGTDLMGWLSQLIASHAVLGVLLPHLLSLVVQLPRIFEIARDALITSGIEGDEATVERLQTLSDSMMDELAGLVRVAIERDEIVLSALDAFGGALDRAMTDPAVAALFDRAFGAALSGTDRMLDVLVRRAIEGDRDHSFVATALVLESLIRSALERALNATSQQRA